MLGSGEDGRSRSGLRKTEVVWMLLAVVGECARLSRVEAGCDLEAMVVFHMSIAIKSQPCAEKCRVGCVSM